MKNAKKNKFKTLTVKQAKEFDRFAREELGIPSLILMENAGRGVTEKTVRFYAEKSWLEISGLFPVLIHNYFIFIKRHANVWLNQEDQ